MNTEQIIEDQVELYVLEQQMPLTYADLLRNALRRAVDHAIQQEREECALAVEQAGIEGLGTLAAAAVIRKRGEEEEYEDPNDYRGMGWVGQDGRP